MEDDLDAAEAGLGQGNSSFHKVRVLRPCRLPSTADGSKSSRRVWLMGIARRIIARKGYDKYSASDFGLRARHNTGR